MAEANVAKAIDEVYENIFRANNALRRTIDMRSFGAAAGDIGDEEDLIAHYSEAAYIQLMALLEVLGITHMHGMVVDLFRRAKKAKDGWRKTRMGPEEPYLEWAAHLHVFADALRAMFAKPAEGIVSKDVEQILRATLYSITDERCFSSPPKDEHDVHVRIEAVLRCLFSDLKHKPPLGKPIKNFEPDTGLPSIRTLVEYKFISTPADAKRVADEILADTRGYVSSEWDSFFYVIYETKRVRPEAEWEGLLRSSGVPHSTKVIVLSGESLPSQFLPTRAGKSGKGRKGKGASGQSVVAFEEVPDPTGNGLAPTAPEPSPPTGSSDGG
ncbi:MAG: hypothetical protein ACOVT5_17080 [Armatimonadaceae bacterium]